LRVNADLKSLEATSERRLTVGRAFIKKSGLRRSSAGISEEQFEVNGAGSRADAMDSRIGWACLGTIPSKSG
jgi:hypothetical protein